MKKKIKKALNELKEVKGIVKQLVKMYLRERKKRFGNVSRKRKL
jgi:hypothetical protein